MQTSTIFVALPQQHLCSLLSLDYPPPTGKIASGRIVLRHLINQIVYKGFKMGIQNSYRIVLGLAIFFFSMSAEAVSPRNPYRTFNLGGVNYGSMRWEKAQRQGRRVWPSYSRSSRSSRRSRSTMTLSGVSGAGAGVITRQGGQATSMTTPGKATATQQSSR